MESNASWSASETTRWAAERPRLRELRAARALPSSVARAGGGLRVGAITQDEARSGRIAEAELVAAAPFGLVESPVRLLQQVSRTQMPGSLKQRATKRNSDVR